MTTSSSSRTLRRFKAPWALLLVLTACSNDASTENEPSSGAAIPETVWTENAPTDAIEVAKARSETATGERVVVRGRVKDFVSNVAAFTLIDHALTPCNEREGDSCETPWDYCCEDAEDQKSHTVLVEIHDAKGKPVRAKLEGLRGVEHLVPVIVAGEASKDEAGNVTIIADALHVVRG